MEKANNEKLCLKWNNFQNNFVSQFEVLKEDEDFVDVTLYCYNQCIKAHKVVLSACSPYFKNIFKDHPCKHPIIILDNLSFNDLSAVIQFIYTGQVYIEQDDLSSFLKAAETLQIRGLSESSGQNLVETNNIPPPQTIDTALVNRKREAEVDYDSKKLRSKRITRRVSNNSIKESNEFYVEQKTTEKDSYRNGSLFERSSENICTNVDNEEQAFDNEEKILTGSNGDEDCIPGESKRPHWLDPRSCILCNRVYSNLSNLRQHMKLIHNPTLVTCKLCFKTFKTDLYLRRHLIGFHELNPSGNGSGNENGNGNSFSVDNYRPIQSQAPDWDPNIKLEPNCFQEMFSSNEMYQIPQ